MGSAVRRLLLLLLRMAGLRQAVQVYVAEFANVDQLINASIWVQVNELVYLIGIVRAIDAHLTGHGWHLILDVLQEVLRYHVDVAAAECGRAAGSEMVRIYVGLHADVVRVAGALVHTPHVIHPVGRPALAVELAPVTRRADRIVGGVLGLDALRSGEEAALARPVPVRSLACCQMVLVRVALMLVRRRHMIQGRWNVPAYMTLVVDGRWPARLTAAHVRLPHLSIVDGQKRVHHRSQIQSIALCLRSWVLAAQLLVVPGV